MVDEALWTEEMGAADAKRQDEKQGVNWHLSMIPLSMAIGLPGLLATVVASELMYCYLTSNWSCDAISLVTAP